MLKRFSGKQKLIVLLAFVILISLTLAACDSSSSDGTSPDPETYQLSFDYLGEGDLPELDGEYDEDSSVEISADPANGWEFFKWEGEGIQDYSEASTSVLVSSDQEIRAIFIEEYDGDANDDGYAGWEGTEEKPYLIKNFTQLDNIRENLDANYILIEDIDLNPEENGEWDPIGNYWWDQDEQEWLSINFTGLLDGRDYTISNLKYKYNDYDNLIPGAGIGFFSVIDNAKVKNIHFKNAEIVSIAHTGIIAGIIQNESVVSGCSTEGSIKADFAIGGITGTSYGGLVSYSSTNVNIISNGADISGDGSLLSNVGGIVGTNNAGEVKNSMSYGNITAEGNNAGGIVGSNRLGEGLVKNSYAKGEIEGIYYVGGLVGDNVGYIEDSYAEGDVNGVDTVGGLVGGSYEGKIENSYAKGDVKGDHRHVGGLTGILQDGEINNSYATGKVFAGANHEENDHGDAGGLVGAVYNNAIITNSHATGEVESNGFNVGGLVGQLHGIIENSYAEGNVEGSRQIGGLVGSMHESTVENSYARGNAGGFDVIGGLVGENYNGIIETSFATGNVNAEGYYYEEAEAYFVNSGGLVGQNEGEIKRCYSTGDVSDIEDAGGVNLGGFVGRNREPGVISESFSTGKVTSHYDTGQVGGFTGFNYHIVHNSYWDIDTSGYDTSGGGEGRTTEQMQAGNANDQIDGENIYEDWDDSIWDFGSDNEYPGFYWE